MQSDAEALADFIREELAFEGELDPDVDLLDEQILDSFSVVQVAMFLQEHFGVELEPEDLNRENLATLNRMLELVKTRRAG